MKNLVKLVLRRLVLSRAGRMQFWILWAFLATFLISRNIAFFDPRRMFFYDGHHIHHYTYGIVILALAGYISLTSKRARYWVAVMFGIGLGMVFDEFAIWMIPSSSYWSDGSYDAIAVVLIVLLVGVYFENFLVKLVRRLKPTAGLRCQNKTARRFAPELRAGRRTFVSLVIPAFNEGQNIARAVRAARAQKYSAGFEVIVADNDSSDDTVKQAEAAGADRVVIERNAQGANAARQAGQAAARGEIVAFIDADCLPAPDWLGKVVERLVGHPGAAAISGPYDHGFEGLKRRVEKVYVGRVLPRAPVILRFFFRKPAGVLIGGNFAAWKSAIDAAGGIAQPKFWGDDAVIAMQLSKVGQVKFDASLEMPTSSRRYEEMGIIRLPLIYIFNYLRAYYTT